MVLDMTEERMTKIIDSITEIGVDEDKAVEILGIFIEELEKGGFDTDYENIKNEKEQIKLENEKLVEKMKKIAVEGVMRSKIVVMLRLYLLLLIWIVFMLMMRVILAELILKNLWRSILIFLKKKKVRDTAMVLRKVVKVKAVLRKILKRDFLECKEVVFYGD